MDTEVFACLLGLPRKSLYLSSNDKKCHKYSAVAFGTVLALQQPEALPTYKYLQEFTETRATSNLRLFLFYFSYVKISSQSYSIVKPRSANPDLAQDWGKLLGPYLDPHWILVFICIGTNVDPKH
jgi:hypothetical protein